jgi:hypothetical protein
MIKTIFFRIYALPLWRPKRLFKVLCAQNVAPMVFSLNTTANFSYILPPNVAN